MAALDTNVLVRWLTNDDEAQCAAVERLMQAALHNGEPLLVPITVLLEVEWVLRSRYRFDKASITAAMDALLSVPELEIQNQTAAEVALWLFKREKSADFADCLHVGLVEHTATPPLLTFDRSAARLDGVELLS